MTVWHYLGRINSFRCRHVLTSPTHAGMNKASAECDPLLRCTTNALDDMELQQLVISAQQANFNLNIEYAIK